MKKATSEKGKRKSYQMLVEQQREMLGLQGFLMHRFMIILFFIVISEFAIKLMLDAFLIPFIQQWFFQNGVWDNSLSILQTFAFVILVFGDLILTGVQSIVPRHIRNMIWLWRTQLQDWAEEIIPELTNNPNATQLEAWEILLLLIAILGVILLFALPLVVSMVWFAKIVTKEVRRIERNKENMRWQYEKKRNLMLSDMAHDLRTPITTISGYAKALNDGMVSEDKQKEYLQAIENKAVRMNDLINLLFEYVKLDSDGFVLNKERCDLSELLRENAALLYSDVEDKGMNFDIDILEDACYMPLDGLQFSRVVTNLINNAIRHNEAGTTITLAMEKEDELVRVIVADDGNLIPSEVASHLFEPFAVGDASRKTKGGSGLGLSIAKKIVEMHGGNLKLSQNYKQYKKAFIIELKNKN